MCLGNAKCAQTVETIIVQHARLSMAARSIVPVARASQDSVLRTLLAPPYLGA